MGSKYLPSSDTPVPCRPGKKWHHQQITGVIMMGTIYSVLYPSHYLKSINIIRVKEKSTISYTMRKPNKDSNLS